ncbi:MAG: hypothetical protein M0P69_14380 [Bacteroidales bacterium]|nr:hypothetical protein [Bacteroidales bacterium]
MSRIGRRIYYDLVTGNVIQDTGERRGSVIATTIESEIATFTALTERNRDTFGVIELEYGQYTQDFAECHGYRVNPETKELEFSYPDPNEEEPQEPVYQTPLSEQVGGLKSQVFDLDTRLMMLEMGGM